jgi:hypothetical protein
MVDHANRYISSGGSEGHPPGYLELHVPSLLLTTAGRKSGEKLFPLFYGDEGNSETSAWRESRPRRALQRPPLAALVRADFDRE